jgi:hypothetical protein
MVHSLARLMSTLEHRCRNWTIYTGATRVLPGEKELDAINARRIGKPIQCGAVTAAKWGFSGLTC